MRHAGIRVGALSLGLGLRANQTLRILVMSRNPMRGEGCFGVLKSVRDNPMSSLELLDFSVRACVEKDPIGASIPPLTPLAFHLLLRSNVYAEECTWVRAGNVHRRNTPIQPGPRPRNSAGPKELPWSHFPTLFSWFGE
uniref:Uncharacterized protein n=1 Tax=Ursus maritimus TaxID=29073 RepID=A0A452TBP8_URSMA